MLTEQVLILAHPNVRVKMDMRTRLLDAAERVLPRSGLAGTTTRAITTEAGCAEGTLYIYFKSRAALFLAIFERMLGPAFASFEILQSQNDRTEPRASMLAVALRFLNFQRDAVPLLAALFAEPALLEQYRELILARVKEAPRAAPALVEYLQRQKRRKRIASGVDPALVAETLLGACFARAFHDDLFDDRPGDAADRKYLRELIALLIPR
ncbi:MAG TPA: TetR/AcrR family transcriptional regulator [Candidatus Cybelea sp.]